MRPGDRAPDYLRTKTSAICPAPYELFPENWSLGPAVGYARLPIVDSNRKWLQKKNFYVSRSTSTRPGLLFFNCLAVWLPFVGNYRTFLMQTGHLQAFELGTA